MISRVWGQSRLIGVSKIVDRTGIYGLFDLGGAAVDMRAVATLGLPAGTDSAGALGAAIDLADPGAAQTDRRDSELTLFLGRLDAAGPIAAQLGLPAGTPDLEIARAALLKFGPDIRALLFGEWTIAHWNGRALVLANSVALRDPLFYAVRGSRVVIGPDLRQLSRIDWIDDRFDPTGLLISMGYEWLRAAIGPSTPIAGVWSLRPGTYLSIDRGGISRAAPPVIEPVSGWSGVLTSAMAEAEALMSRIVRQRMVGGSYTCLLSGGLDSSTLAWLIANNLRPDEQLHFLTSAAGAPGQIDEFNDAAIVAAHLGVPHVPVIAGQSAGPYRPGPDHFRGRNGPSLSLRHYLYDGFAATSRALGAPLLFDGLYGEMTFTNRLPLRGETAGIRNALKHLRTYLNEPTLVGADALFHVNLARHWLAHLPPDIEEARRRKPRAHRFPSRRELWGVSPAITRAYRATPQFELGRVRQGMPFRDPRLVALFASFPAKMLYPEVGARTPARELLKGKLPDAIRLRGKGPGIAPDYSERIKTEAGAARERIPLFRRAGADEWIDLEVLDRGLARNGAGISTFGEATRTQLTALAGEFFVWWRSIS